MRSILGAALALLLCEFPLLTYAQQATPDGQPSAAGPTAEEISKAAVNPFADYIKLPFEFTTAFDSGEHHNASAALNFQPLLPLTLSKDWLLLVRPSVSAIYVPAPHEQYGMGELQTSFFLTPAGEKTWVLGAGPIFQFPTASARSLGTGRWSAGPTAGIVYSEGPWFAGVLSYHLMSFAGDRERGSVNETSFEPEVSYTFDNGTYVQCDPTMTYDWTAERSDAWTVPAGLDFGTSMKLGSQDLTLQIGSYDLAIHPTGAPQWIVRASGTLLFSSRP